MGKNSSLDNKLADNLHSGELETPVGWRTVVSFVTVVTIVVAILTLLLMISAPVAKIDVMPQFWHACLLLEIAILLVLVYFKPNSYSARFRYASLLGGIVSLVESIVLFCYTVVI